MSNDNRRRNLSGPIMTPQRRAVIKILQDLGGEIGDDKGGRAWTDLRDLVKQEFPDVDIGERSSLALAMEKDGIIARKINGKRCYRVALTPLFRHYDTTQAPPWVKTNRYRIATVRTATPGPDGSENWSRSTIVNRARVSHHQSTSTVQANVADVDVDLTDEEPDEEILPAPLDPYTGLARVLLAEVLDLKVELERQLNEERGDIGRYQHAMDELKAAAADLHKANEQKGQALLATREQLAQAEANNSQLVAKVNELEFKLKAARTSIRRQVSPNNKYPISELTEGGQQAWKDLLALMEAPTNSNQEETQS